MVSIKVVRSGGGLFTSAHNEETSPSEVPMFVTAYVREHKSIKPRRKTLSTPMEYR